MKTYFLFGPKRVRNKTIRQELTNLICDIRPFYVDLYEDCSPSEFDFSYAYQYYFILYQNEPVIVVDDDLFDEDEFLEPFPDGVTANDLSDPFDED